MAVAAPVITFSCSAALFFLMISSPLIRSLARPLDVSSACPHILTSANLHNYQRPSNDTLLVVVPWKKGFEQFVNFNPAFCVIDGFSVQVFLQALRHMLPPNPFPYQFVLHGDGNQSPFYDEMIDMVVNGSVDAVVADMTITRERMERVGFTMPYLASSLVMVTPFRYGSAGTLWDFLKPFSTPLWLTLFGSFVATGAALYVLENKNPDFSTAHTKVQPVTSSGSPSASVPASTAPTAEAASSTQTDHTCLHPSFLTMDLPSLLRPGIAIYDRASHKRRILNAYWFTSLCVFAAQQESVRTHLGRFVAVMWLFIMLIFNSSYTASLASLLSAQRMFPTIGGFQALLSDKNISVGYQPSSFLEGFMNKTLIDQSRRRPFLSERDYLRALNEGNRMPDGVGAVLDELPYVQILLQSECFFTRGPADDSLPSWAGFGLAFHKNSPLLEEFSKSIVAMKEDATLQGLQKWWGIGGAKWDSCSATAEPSHLRLKSFGGLFGVLCGAYVFCLVWRVSTKAVQSDGEICINALACARGGCNICRGVSSSGRSRRVSDVSLEHSEG